MCELKKASRTEEYTTVLEPFTAGIKKLLFKENQVSFVHPILAFLIFSFFHLGWIAWVNPSPSDDPLYHFYIPIQRSLAVIDLMPIDELNFDMVASMLSKDYPIGFANVVWITHMFGVSNVFHDEPYLFTIFLILPVVLCSFLIAKRTQQFYLFAFLLFFFPGTQILLRSFNMVGWNILWALLCIVIIGKIFSSKKPTAIWFVCLFFSAYLAAATKHLGYLYLILLVIIVLCWGIAGLKGMKYRVFFLLFFCLPVCSTAYHEFSGISYVNMTIGSHNSWAGAILENRFWIWIGLLSFVFLLRVLLKKGLKLKSKWPIFLVFLSIVGYLSYLLPMSFVPNVSNTIPLLMISGINLFFLIGTIFLETPIQTRFLMISAIVQFQLSSALCCLGFGEVGYLFFLPLLICLVLLCLSNATKLKAGLLTIFILISNFFPAYENRDVLLHLPFSSKHIFKIYKVYFETKFTNLLGWNVSKIRKARARYQKLIEQVGNMNQPPIVIRDNRQGLYDQLQHFWNFDSPFRQPEYINKLQEVELKQLLQAFCVFH